MGSVETQTTVVVSSDRVEPGSFPLFIANLPKVTPPRAVDPDTAATQWVETFNKTVRNGEITGISELFLQESYWRDQLCLSWDFHTLQGPQKIVSLLVQSKNGSRIKSLTLDKSSELRSPKASVLDASGQVHTIQAFLKVDTDVGRGAGIVRLVQEQGRWKAFTLFTFLTELKGHEELVGQRRPNGVSHGAHLSRENWLDRRIAEQNFENGQEPTVLILGEGWSFKYCSSAL